MEKLWSKDYVLNIVGNLLLFVVFYLLMVYTTKLAITEFNVSVMSITLGSAIGPFLGISLPQINPLYALVLCDVLSISLIVLAFILNITEIKVGFRQRVEVKSFRLRTFFEPTAIPISIVALLGAIGYSAVMSYIGTYSETIGLLLGGSLVYFI